MFSRKFLLAGITTFEEIRDTANIALLLSNSGMLTLVCLSVSISFTFSIFLPLCFSLSLSFCVSQSPCVFLTSLCLSTSFSVSIKLSFSVLSFPDCFRMSLSLHLFLSVCLSLMWCWTEKATNKVLTNLRPPVAYHRPHQEPEPWEESGRIPRKERLKFADFL